MGSGLLSLHMKGIFLNRVFTEGIRPRRRRSSLSRCQNIREKKKMNTHMVGALFQDLVPKVQLFVEND